MGMTIFVANWKMNKTISDLEPYFRDLKESFPAEAAEVVICPSFPLLAAAGKYCQEQGLHLGAQNMFWEASGPFTGEVSPLLLRDLGVQYVIIGHSERRQLFNETDQHVARKVKAALEAGLKPIICVGETFAQRRAGQTKLVIEEQLGTAFSGLDPSQLRRLVVAYEPLWAIGTGLPATAAQAGEAALQIRKQAGELFNLKAARYIRILYGGSVTPGNIQEFFSCSELDGVLVGGTSLDAGNFAALIKAALARD